MYPKSGDDRCLVVTVIRCLITVQLPYNQLIEVKSDEWWQMYHYLPVELGLFYAYIANEFICHCLFQIAHLLSAAFFTATENIYFVLKRNTHNLPRTLNSQELFSILSAFKPILPGRRFIPYFLGKITVSTVKTVCLFRFFCKEQ